MAWAWHAFRKARAASRRPPVVLASPVALPALRPEVELRPRRPRRHPALIPLWVILLAFIGGVCAAGYAVQVLAGAIWPELK